MRWIMGYLVGTLLLWLLPWFVSDVVIGSLTPDVGWAGLGWLGTLFGEIVVLSRRSPYRGAYRAVAVAIPVLLLVFERNGVALMTTMLLWGLVVAILYWNLRRAGPERPASVAAGDGSEKRQAPRRQGPQWYPGKRVRVNPEAPIDTTIRLTKKLEAVLRRNFGGDGRGLHEIVTSVEERLPVPVQKRLRYIATVRNAVMHEEDYELTEEIFRNLVAAVAAVLPELQEAWETQVAMDQRAMETGT